jgi:hypothetical protein
MRIVTGIVGATTTWIANNRGLVTTAAQIAASVISIGAGLAIIGQTISTVGSGFGLVATVASTIGGLLSTPLGIVVAIGAAVGLGVAAWMRFTESGQAAAKMLLDYFAPTIDFIKQLIGGIGDALMAGDLSLAGQIAVKGLQIVFVDGLNTIADLIGGTLGDTLGVVASEITSGNITGAWQTVVKGMAKLWADFSQGVVTVFTSAAKAVVDAWQSSVNAIANGLLKAASGDGIMARIAKLIVGYDVGELQRFNDEKDAQRGIKQNIFDIGAGSIKDSTNAIADPIKGFLDSVNEQAVANADQADHDLKERIRGRRGERGDTGKLQDELDVLTKRAAKERAAVPEKQLPTREQLGSVAVGFSGAGLALQLMGGAGDPQKQLLGEAKKQRELQADAVKLLESMNQVLQKFGFR